MADTETLTLNALPQAINIFPEKHGFVSDFAYDLSHPIQDERKIDQCKG